jgi:hypothetical protein
MKTASFPDYAELCYLWLDTGHESAVDESAGPRLSVVRRERWQRFAAETS